MNIKFVNVTEKLHDKIILKHFNYEFKEKKINVLLGNSGVGKSTVLRLLMGLEQADEGEVIGIENLKKSAVFPEDRLIENLSVSLNIRLPRLKDNKEELNKEILDNLKFLGLEDIFDKPVNNLSRGMKKKISILRALLADFDVIFFDEATLGMREKEKNTVMSLINKYIKDKTVFWVCTDINDLKYFESYELINLDEINLFN